MKILIADDERLVRLSLKNMLDELYPNKFTYIEARHGKELIKLSKEYQPDICFVDINMPLLDGISAIKLCRENCPNTEWFILTGEAEFSFVKEAINIGVRNYLLKPVSLSILKDNLDNAEKIISNKKLDLNKNFQLDIMTSINTNLTFNNYVISDDFYNLNDEHYTSILLIFDTSLNEDIKNITIKNFTSELYLLLCNDVLTKDNFNFSLFNLNSGELSLVIKSKNIININTYINKLHYDDFFITAVISMCSSTLKELYEEIQLLREYSPLRAISNLTTPIIIDNFKKINNCSEMQFSKDIILLCDYFSKINKLKYIELVNKINLNCNYKNLFNKIEISNLSRFLSLKINFNYNFNSFDEFISLLLNHANNMSQYNNIKSKDIIDEIIDYININYMNDIGVSTIADIYHITPNYLSKMFHEKSGMKLSDYITYKRITEGKKMLLQNKSLTVKEVANKVGYFTPRHFTKQFFKLEGIYPSDLNK